MLPPILPSNDELTPQLQRLETEPGSVILIALELPETQNFPRVQVGYGAIGFP
jgi:hypothetical protein